MLGFFKEEDLRFRFNATGAGKEKKTKKQKTKRKNRGLKNDFSLPWNICLNADIYISRK